MTTAEKRRVLITGASSGIGLEAAKILLARGDELTVLCRNAERADATRAALSDSVQTCIADLADLKSVAQAIEALLHISAVTVVRYRKERRKGQRRPI